MAGIFGDTLKYYLSILVKMADIPSSHVLFEGGTVAKNINIGDKNVGYLENLFDIGAKTVLQKCFVRTKNLFFYHHFT